MPTRRNLRMTPTRSPARAAATKKAPAKKAAARKMAAAAAPAGLTEAQVRTILRFHLKNLSTSNAPTTDDTVLGEALSDLSVAGMSARALFKAVSRRDIVVNGGPDKTWPANWTTLTVATLAPKLVA